MPFPSRPVIIIGYENEIEVGSLERGNPAGRRRVRRRPHSSRARHPRSPLDATHTDDGLALHIKHAGNQIPIDGRDVTVSVDGKSQPVTAAPEGTFLLSTKNLAGDGERQFDIVVAHDGIREILTGKVLLPKVGATLDLWRDHKQMAWWVLNVAIVLIAVMAFSRRQSKPAKEDEDD